MIETKSRCPTHFGFGTPPRDPLRDPAALLTKEGSLSYSERVKARRRSI